MRNRVLPRLNDQQVPSSVVGMYGSGRAGQFLRDAMRGTDSVDIVVIGDSNAGFPVGHGYVGGWNKVMQFGMHVPQYATPICSGGPVSPTALTTGNSSNGREMMWGVGISQAWNAQGVAGGSNSPTSCKQMIQSTDSEIVGLRNWLGFNTTNYNVNDTTNKMLFPQGWMNNPIVVETGQRYTSNNASVVNLLALTNQTIAGINSFGSEMAFGTSGTGGNSLEYRIVYGTFPTAGSFKPHAFYMNTINAISRDSVVSTGGGYGFQTRAFRINSFTLGAQGVSPFRVGFTWDGANSATTADQANGPFACLWQSIIRPDFKGYSVSCLNYFGGVTTTQIAEKIEDCDKMLDAYLKELRERQIGSTPGTAGTGRVIVFCNSGTNGPDTSTTWVQGAERIRNRIASRWVSTGGNLSQLAFVFTVTHPTADAGIAWTASRAAVSAAANAWATSNATDGYGSSVVDINDAYTTIVLSRYSMYDSTLQTHLNIVAVPPAAVTTAVDAYEAIVQRVVTCLIS